MKKKIIVAALGLCLTMPMWAQSAESSSLKTFEQKLSYSIGNDIGKSLVELKGKVELDAVLDGISDTYKGADLKLTPEQITEVQQQFVKQMQEEQAKKIAEMKSKNKEAGEKYLAANKAKKGVVVTESGLQYKFVKKGKGAIPKADDIVTVDYTGTLVNGTKFDSSVERGEPATFSVGQVIPGWSEALQLMPVGSEVKLVIPSDLAYGENGAPPVIEPNSVLVFDVKLISIGEPKDKAAEKKEAKK